MIKLYAPNFTMAAMQQVLARLQLGDIYGGRAVLDFEDAFAEYVGADHAVAVDSCTSALFLSLKYFQPERATIPSVTFCSVANAILHSGTELNFNDEIAVGYSYELGFSGIWDSAHEVKRRDDWVGLSAVCYSFYPTKPVGGLGGGMIATNNDGFADWARQARNHGSDRREYESAHSVKFAGWKMQMNELQAAIGLEQLKGLPERDAIMRDIRDEYTRHGIASRMDSQHVFAILSNDRVALEQALDDRDIQHSIHFQPLHLQPAYADYARRSYPYSELWGKQELSLPFHDALRLDDIETIANTLKEAGYG